MPDPPAVFYHFTCIDGHKQIGRYNCALIPQRGTWPVIWLTTERVPDFEATGLKSVTLKCDRTQYRYIVRPTPAIRPWLGSPERDAEDPAFVRLLEEFGAPGQWWISAEPLRATWDRTWTRETAMSP